MISGSEGRCHLQNYYPNSNGKTWDMCQWLFKDRFFLHNTNLYEEAGGAGKVSLLCTWRDKQVEAVLSHLLGLQGVLRVSRLPTNISFPPFWVFLSVETLMDKSSCVLNVDEVRQQAFLWKCTYVYRLFVHLAGDFRLETSTAAYWCLSLKLDCVCS